MTDNKNANMPPESKIRNSNILFKKLTADIQTLKKMIEHEHWTIEYYETFPTINIIRSVDQKMEFPTAYEPRENEFNRLRNSTGSTQLWGCAICHKFYIFPSLLFDDLFKNHHIKPDIARCSQYIVKLNVLKSDLFEILKNDKK